MFAVLLKTQPCLERATAKAENVELFGSSCSTNVGQMLALVLIVEMFETIDGFLIHIVLEVAVEKLRVFDFHRLDFWFFLSRSRALTVKEHGMFVETLTIVERLTALTWNLGDFVRLQ